MHYSWTTVRLLDMHLSHILTSDVLCIIPGPRSGCLTCTFPTYWHLTYYALFLDHSQVAWHAPFPHTDMWCTMHYSWTMVRKKIMHNTSKCCQSTKYCIGISELGFSYCFRAHEGMSWLAGHGLEEELPETLHFICCRAWGLLPFLICWTWMHAYQQKSMEK